MSFNRDLLPGPEGYYTDRAGLTFRERKGKWRTAACVFHGSSDSMRINIDTGAFVCMAGCSARGGDVLAYHMAAHGLGFIEAAKALGCWVEDGSPAPAKPAPFTARQALGVLAVEANLVAIAAGNIAQGVALTQGDFERLKLAASRLIQVTEVFA